MVAIKKTKKQPTPGFKSNLKDISRYKTWPKMTKEWLFLAYYLITGQYKTCPGDPKRITHICVIINEHNHNQLEICNSCAERYMDIFECGKIENDVRRLKANIKLSMSSTSLDYLRDNHAISTDEYNGYQMVRGIRNDSYVLEFRSDINQKLLAITDYNNKSAFDTIDQIVIWIHKNASSDIDIKTLFDTRHSLLSTNTYNSEWLESIVAKNKIGSSNYSLTERAEAYKIFDKYLNIPNEEWSRFIKYYGKDLETNIEKEVLPKGVIRNKRGVLTYNLDLEPDTIIKKDVNEKVDKQYNRESSEAAAPTTEEIIQHKTTLSVGILEERPLKVCDRDINNMTLCCLAYDNYNMHCISSLVFEWAESHCESNSFDNIVAFFDCAEVYNIINKYGHKKAIDLFKCITTNAFKIMLDKLCMLDSENANYKIEKLNSLLQRDYKVGYNSLTSSISILRKEDYLEQKRTKPLSTEKMKKEKRKKVPVIKSQPTEPIEEVASSPVVEVKDFSYLLASNNNSKDEANKGSSDPEIERRWIESFNQSNEQSKQHARDLNKLEKDADILILDSITSQSLYHLESFILKYLKQLTSSDSIQMFALTFDQIEISDVYEVNPNITSLYTFMSKLSFGCIKNVLTQLLSQRLNKSKVNVSDIIKNPMVIELEKILSGENLVLKYTGYTKPFQSAYWKIEPQ